MMGIPSKDFYYMPIGELSDLLDANDILNGYCDENLPMQNISVELR